MWWEWQHCHNHFHPTGLTRTVVQNTKLAGGINHIMYIAYDIRVDIIVIHTHIHRYLWTNSDYYTYISYIYTHLLVNFNHCQPLLVPLRNFRRTCGMAIFDNAATSQRSRESFFRCSQEDSVQGGRRVSWVYLQNWIQQVYR